MKKLFFRVLLPLLVLCSCSEDRDNTLKIYNWSCYIGEGVIDDFKQWYKANTGEEIEVIYQTFDVNETMLSKIEKGKEDFDLVCPSDYIIERMLNNGLLLPLDFASIPDSLNYIRNNRSPYIEKMFRDINPKVDANDYSVAYMWGTTGLLYNTKYVSEEDADSWGAIADPRFSGHIFIKDACRDVYGPVLIHLRQKELSEGSVTLDELMKDSSEKSLSDVEEFLKGAREHVAGWEADFGKEQMAQERGWLSLNWSGDAMWAIEVADSMGISLAYKVPSEGSNVWFDGWAIPKYARNVKAATWFIDFMCRPDIAIRNMEETGYVSANGSREVLDSQTDESQEPIDVSYFFPGADSVRVNPAMYPARSTIERCALMHDWGEDSSKLVSMWSRVKGDRGNTSTYVVIILFASILLLAAIRAKKPASHRKKVRKRR